MLAAGKALGRTAARDAKSRDAIPLGENGTMGRAIACCSSPVRELYEYELISKPGQHGMGRVFGEAMLDCLSRG